MMTMLMLSLNDDYYQYDDYNNDYYYRCYYCSTMRKSGDVGGSDSDVDDDEDFHYRCYYFQSPYLCLQLRYNDDFGGGGCDDVAADVALDDGDSR